MVKFFTEGTVNYNFKAKIIFAEKGKVSPTIPNNVRERERQTEKESCGDGEN